MTSLMRMQLGCPLGFKVANAVLDTGEYAKAKAEPEAGYYFPEDWLKQENAA